MNYTVLQVTGNYEDRQRQANDAGAICYFEQHCNALGSAMEDPNSTRENYALGLIANNGSETSERWAKTYASLCAERCADLIKQPWPDGGCYRAEPFKSGDKNLRDTKMPALIGEPGFVSDPTQAEFMATLYGQYALAVILFESIKAVFPGGGLVALSVGHVGQPDTPGDRGAPVTGSELWESDIAALIIKQAVPLFLQEIATEHTTTCPHCSALISLVAA